MGSELKTFMIRWSNDHPLDRGFREKYNISFNSPQHREINQFDILLEYLENTLIQEYEERVEKDIKNRELYEKGIWLNENVTEEENEDFFNKLDISSINNNSQLQIEE